MSEKDNTFVETVIVQYNNAPTYMKVLKYKNIDSEVELVFQTGQASTRIWVTKNTLRLVGSALLGVADRLEK